MNALLYLTLRRALNSIKRIPRNPRLLVPILLFGFVLVSQILPLVALHGRGTGSGRNDRHLAEQFAALSTAVPGTPESLLLAVRGMLMVFVISAVVTALNEGTLFFSLSDIDYLFPGPFPRRLVLLFRMLTLYLGLLAVALYLPLVIGGAFTQEFAGISPVRLWPGVLGMLLFLIAANNFAQAAVLVRWGNADKATDASEKRRAQLRFALGTLLALITVAALYFFTRFAIQANPGLDLRRILQIGNGPAFGVLFAPVVWASDLFRVAYEGWSGLAFARLAGLAALCGVSFVALFSRDRDFYDGATELSAKRQRTIAAVRGGDTGALLSQLAQEGKLPRGQSLRDFGGGALAVLWKDLISITRTPPRGWVTLGVLALLPAMMGLLVGRRSDIGLLVWMVLFNLQIARVFLVGLRDVLRRADMSKTLPITPIRFLAAELASSVLQLTLLGYFSLTAMVLTGGGRGPLLPVVYLVFPTVAALIILVQTGFVLIYPRQDDPAQAVVGNLLGLLVSVCALFPAITLGVILHLLGAAPATLGLAVAAVNLLGSAAVLLIDAALWIRFDPTT